MQELELFILWMLVAWGIFDLGRCHEWIVQQVKIETMLIAHKCKQSMEFVKGWNLRNEHCKKTCLKRNPKTGKIMKREIA